MGQSGKDCQDADEPSEVIISNHGYLSKCVKLRRCVIAVIAANRMSRLSTRRRHVMLDEVEIDWVVNSIAASSRPQAN